MKKSLRLPNGEEQAILDGVQVRLIERTERLERTGPDRRLGSVPARLLCQTRSAQTFVLPTAVQKRLPQSSSRSAQSLTGGSGTKSGASLHAHDQRNSFDGATF